MISIIISSINPVCLSALKKNIEDTIGVVYEIIAIDNRSGDKGICEVYNLGAVMAKYDVFCFMHEDILFRTLGWGERVIDAFKNNKKLGLIGVAGSQYKSLAPSSWYFEMNPEVTYYQIIQHYKYENKEKSTNYANATHAKLTKVACIDGVWMCTTRDAFNVYPFDEILLKGFHGYDIDFSLGINQNYETAVTFDVLIEHFSEGNLNKIWLEEILKVHTKWSHILPINLTSISQDTLIQAEKRAFKNMLKRMWAYGFKYNEMHRLVWNSTRSRIMKPTLFFKIHRELIKYIFKNR